MDVSPSALLVNFLPRLPSILLTALLAVFGWTPNSHAQDTITQIIIAAARPILRTPAQIGRSQRVWLRIGVWSSWTMELVSWFAGILGIEGYVGSWCGTRITWEVSSVEGIDEGKGEKAEVMTVREAVAFAFNVLCDPRHGDIKCPNPDLADVEVEWTSPRSRSASPNNHSSSHSPSDSNIQSQNRITPVILYLHGGAHCLMDPTTHRETTSTLSNLSNAEVCAVRFRLSPQHPFPCALTDAFIAYLSLLAPQASSSHEPVHPSRIVLAGDSSGGGLAASLLLLILTLSRNDICLTFHSQTINFKDLIPAGLALTSPWLDVTRCLPSTSLNEKWDIIAPPPLDSASPPFPRDETWPTDPPRAETYCTADLCAHPLVSPLAATSEMWKGAPPVWLACGWEGFTDEVEVFARRVYLSSEQARVIFGGWEGMPHCFGMVPWNLAGWEAMISWAGFCADVIRGNIKRRTMGVWVRSMRRGEAKGKEGMGWREVKLEELGLERVGVGYVREQPLTDEVVDGLMEKGRLWRIRLEEEMVRRWKERAL